MNKMSLPNLEVFLKTLPEERIKDYSPIDDYIVSLFIFKNITEDVLKMEEKGESFRDVVACGRNDDDLQNLSKKVNELTCELIDATKQFKLNKRRVKQEFTLVEFWDELNKHDWTYQSRNIMHSEFANAQSLYRKLDAEKGKSEEKYNLFKHFEKWGLGEEGEFAKPERPAESK